MLRKKNLTAFLGSVYEANDRKLYNMAVKVGVEKKSSSLSVLFFQNRRIRSKRSMQSCQIYFVLRFFQKIPLRLMKFVFNIADI